MAQVMMTLSDFAAIGLSRSADGCHARAEARPDARKRAFALAHPSSSQKAFNEEGWIAGSSPGNDDLNLARLKLCGHPP
jgi:hypothetical protein